MLDFIRLLWNRQRPADERLWHPWTPIVPVRLTNGRWSVVEPGQIWRRRAASGKWEWRQDEETDDGFDQRAY